MSNELLYEVTGKVAHLTINRESKRNALDEATIGAFLEALDRADGNPEVRALCVTGAGDKAFCAGADLGALTADGAGRLPGAEAYAELLKRLPGFGKPTVARVNGPCLAGGLGIMLACDLVIAREDTFFCAPEANVGIFPMMVGALLYRNVGRKKAMEMVLTGRRVPAPEAARMGLVTRVVPPAELDDQVNKLLAGLVARSPIGLRMGKEAFHAMADLPLDDAVDLLCRALGRVAATGDAAEGMAAFREKREPRFKGE